MNEKPEDQNIKDSEHQEVNKELRSPEEVAAAEEVEILQKLPPHVGKQVEIFKMMAASSFSQSRGLSDKLTENHITKILELQEKQIDYEHETGKQGRNQFLFIYILTGLLFLVLVFFLVIRNKDALLLDIIKIVGAFACGFGAGIGAKSQFDKKR